MTARWGKITLAELINPMKGKLISGDFRTSPLGFSTDTRDIRPGEIFLALRGEKFDGHCFVSKAIEKGASCIILEDEACFPADSKSALIKVGDSLEALGDIAAYWRSGYEVSVVSITGSMGKTTTKEMTSCILEAGTATLKNNGNFNNLIGLPLTLLRLDSSHKRVVLEMGMNREGEIGRLTQISDPDIGLITNIGPVHLEGVKDMAGVARAKTEMIEEIRPESKVILFGDDKLLMEKASRFNRNFFTFGFKPGNDLTATDIKDMGDSGISYVLKYEDKAMPVRLQVPGYHNLNNSLAAASVAVCLNESIENIKTGLERFKGIKGRLVPEVLPGNIILLDDTYNSNPSSLKAALGVAKRIAGTEKRMIVGLGEMLELGDETEKFHIEAGGMVAEAEAFSFFAIGAHADLMLKGAVENDFPSDNAIEVGSSQEMVEKISSIMDDGDLILLKGSRLIGLERVAEGLREYSK
ncbi:UDP-N-acetylmuramoyl-tripeptide--D-alanyl-D-alanine ligase [Thermodesulfobacteriota bacterium]